MYEFAVRYNEIGSKIALEIDQFNSDKLQGKCSKI